MTINFEKSEDGWLAQSGKYKMRREGLRVGERFTLFVNGQREVSFFAIPGQARGPDGNEYTWTLGASQRTGRTSVGFETYATLFGAFFNAYQGSRKLPSGSVVIAFDPDIQRKAWDQWGP
jgi:hypothetical protein